MHTKKELSKIARTNQVEQVDETEEDSDDVLIGNSQEVRRAVVHC